MKSLLLFGFLLSFINIYSQDSVPPSNPRPYEDGKVYLVYDLQCSCYQLEFAKNANDSMLFRKKRVTRIIERFNKNSVLPSSIPLHFKIINVNTNLYGASISAKGFDKIFKEETNRQIFIKDFDPSKLTSTEADNTRAAETFDIDNESSINELENDIREFRANYNRLSIANEELLSHYLDQDTQVSVLKKKQDILTLFEKSFFVKGKTFDTRINNGKYVLEAGYVFSEFEGARSTYNSVLSRLNLIKDPDKRKLIESKVDFALMKEDFQNVIYSLRLSKMLFQKINEEKRTIYLGRLSEFELGATEITVSIQENIAEKENINRLLASIDASNQLPKLSGKNATPLTVFKTGGFKITAGAGVAFAQFDDHYNYEVVDNTIKGSEVGVVPMISAQANGYTTVSKGFRLGIAAGMAIPFSSTENEVKRSFFIGPSFSFGKLDRFTFVPSFNLGRIEVLKDEFEIGDDVSGIPMFNISDNLFEKYVSGFSLSFSYNIFSKR